MFHTQRHNENDLRLVKRAEDFRDQREPAIRIGDVVRWNSGSEKMLVVDIDGMGLITTAWRNANGLVEEWEAPEVCFHRIPVLDD